jgi:hypothetical protein
VVAAHQVTETAPVTLVGEIEAFLALTANRNTFTAEEIQDFLLDLHIIASDHPEQN